MTLIWKLMRYGSIASIVINRHYRPTHGAARARRAVLPRRLRRPRLLIVGCGDVGLRLLGQLAGRARSPWRIIATTRDTGKQAAIRALGATPVRVDLDDAGSLRRLRGLASRVIHLAPPPSSGLVDTRTRHLLAAIAQPGHGPAICYASTTGVYGDAHGAQFDETRPVAPVSERAQRRVSGERLLRAAARRSSARVFILRVPGIYANDRLPTARLGRGLPALTSDEDGYSNHIHAEDLAHLLWISLYRARNTRLYHAADQSRLKMGDWFDLVADATGMPRPPRLGRDAVRAQVSAVLWSFMRESRRIIARRIGRELRARLRYPTPDLALHEVALERLERSGQYPLSDTMRPDSPL